MNHYHRRGRVRLFSVLLCIALLVSGVSAAEETAEDKALWALQREAAYETFAFMADYWDACGKTTSPYDPAKDFGGMNIGNLSGDAVRAAVPEDYSELIDPLERWNCFYEPFDGVYIEASYYPNSGDERPQYSFGLKRMDSITPEEFDTLLPGVFAAIIPELTIIASAELFSELIYNSGPITEEGDTIVGVLQYGGWMLYMTTDLSSDLGLLFFITPTSKDSAYQEFINTSFARIANVERRQAEVFAQLGYVYDSEAEVDPLIESNILLLRQEVTPGIMYSMLFQENYFCGYSYEITPSARAAYDEDELFQGIIWALNPTISDDGIASIYAYLIETMTEYADGTLQSDAYWIDNMKQYSLLDHDGCRHLSVLSFFSADE